MSASEELPLSWANLHAATCDAEGNVYVLASDSESTWTLASLDPECRLRWTQPAPTTWGYMEAAAGQALSAWSAAGSLALWTRGRHSLHLVSCSDGTLTTTLDGVEGHRRLGVARARSVSVDGDTTLLIVSGGVLRRFSSAAEPLPLWQGKAFTELTLAEPQNAEHVRAFAGWDGATWTVTYQEKTLFWERLAGSSPRWRKHDRRGEVLASSGPFYLLSQAGDAWADRDGRPYSDWVVAKSYPAITRYTADLKSFEYCLLAARFPSFDTRAFDAHALRPTRAEPPQVHAEHVACLAPDGTFWVFGPHGALRRFGPDGSPTFRSRASREDDARRQ